MGVIKILFSVTATLLISSLIILLIPGIPPDIQFEAYHIPDPIKLEGWFATNTILDEAELYYKSPVGGIESLAVLTDDEIYTGDASGAVLKITGKQVAKEITKVKFPCDDIHKTPIVIEQAKQETCGWPLGMRIDKGGKLLFMDYYGGLTRVNLKTGEYENLVPKAHRILNKQTYIPEDLDEAQDASIYWTDGSTTGEFYVETLSQPSGRLLRYDPVKRKNEVLLENLHASNGVCLSEDNEFVLAAECGRNRITRYYLKGAKKGQNDTFIDRLPGYPDNIRPNGRGGFYVPLVFPWTDNYSWNIHLLSPRPIIRKLILRSRHLLLNIISEVKRFLPGNTYLETVEDYIHKMEPVLKFSKAPKVATIVELSKSGDVIGVLNGKAGKVHTISQISLGKKYAFLISPFAGKIWRIKVESLRKMS